MGRSATDTYEGFPMTPPDRAAEAAFELWHDAQSACCHSHTCPHKEWERIAYRAGLAAGRQELTQCFACGSDPATRLCEVCHFAYDEDCWRGHQHNVEHLQPTPPAAGRNADTTFLHWMADRLVHVYHESPNVDFVRKLHTIADSLDAAREGEG